MKISVKVIPNAKKDEVKLAGNNVEDGLIVKVCAVAEIFPICYGLLQNLTKLRICVIIINYANLYLKRKFK
jgi:hypothetical protein